MTDPGGRRSAVVRPRRPDDLDACVAALALVHEHSGYPVDWPERPAAWLTPAALLAGWAAELDGRVVGHVALCAAEEGDAAAVLWNERPGRPAPAVVSRLFVSPAARGHGIGAALLERAVEGARSRGLHPVLDVVAADPAAAFYERLGWQGLGAVVQQWGPARRVLLNCYAAPPPVRPAVD